MASGDYLSSLHCQFGEGASVPLYLVELNVGYRAKFVNQWRYFVKLLPIGFVKEKSFKT